MLRLCSDTILFVSYSHDLGNWVQREFHVSGNSWDVRSTWSIWRGEPRMSKSRKSSTKFVIQEDCTTLSGHGPAKRPVCCGIRYGAFFSRVATLKYPLYSKNRISSHLNGN